jgi:hypothetical protein
MAHAEKSYGSHRSREGLAVTDLLSMLALAVLAGGLIGFVVYEGVRLLLDLVY